MTKCANCTAQATLVYSLSNSHNTYYCSAHAPRAVKNLLVSLATEDELVQQVEQIKKTTKKQTKTTVINSAPVEEVVDSNSNENEPTEEEVTDNEPNE